MIEKLLHTPEGVRDIYSKECKEKAAVEERLRGVLDRFGYQQIETPTFEFFDVFNHDTGTVSSREMFKFFDRSNNTLVLRPDMTPSIARSVAKYYSETDMPLKLSYKGNTFLNNPRYQGKLTEKTEMGAEYINDDSAAADAEAIVMMIECFLEAGLRDFRVDIGQAEFYKGLMDALEVSREIKSKINEYIENKNSLAMEGLLDQVDIPESYRRILVEYDELYGDVHMLDKAMELTGNRRCKRAVSRLQEVYEVLKLYGYEKYVSFDLGMVNHFDYYTGIIFRGYTFGTGDAIGKGGRYDNLLVQFGKKAPAIGFTILVDDLLMAMSRQNIEISTRDYGYMILLYDDEDLADAISLVMGLRKGGKKMELLRRSEQKEMTEYIKFALDQGADGLLRLENGQVVIHDFSTSAVKVVSLAQLREEY